MSNREVAFFIIDLYEEYSRELSVKENKKLLPLIYEDITGDRQKWLFAEEHIIYMHNFILALIEFGFIKGKVLTVASSEEGMENER